MCGEAVTDHLPPRVPSQRAAGVDEKRGHSRRFSSIPVVAREVCELHCPVNSEKSSAAKQLRPRPRRTGPQNVVHTPQAKLCKMGKKKVSLRTSECSTCNGRVELLSTSTAADDENANAGT